MNSLKPASWLFGALLPGVLFGGTVFAQATIEGRVVIEGTNQGIADVQIQSSDDHRTTTDAGGAFRLEGVRITDRSRILAAKPGYTSSSATITTDDHFPQITEEKIYAPGEKILIGLSVLPTITGRVVDAETGEPVEGVPMALANVFDSPARAIYDLQNYGFSDTDGVFSMQSHTVDGAIAVHVDVAESRSNPYKTRFDPDKWDVVEQKLVGTYWPGGGDKYSVLPVDITGRREVDVGTIEVEYEPVYRVLFDFPEAGCQDDQRFNVVLFHDDDPPRRVGLVYDVQCGTDFLVTDLRPGSYMLRVDPLRIPVPEQRFARIPFQIVDENLQEKIVLQPGAPLDGRIKLPDGMRLDGENPFEGLAIQLTDANSQHGIQSAIQVKEDGTFHIENLPLGTVRIGLIGRLPEGLMLSRATHHGLPLPLQIPVRYRILDWDGIGPVEFELGQNGGSITVSLKGDESSPFTLLLSPWPIPTGVRPYPDIAAGGSVQVSDLPPGEYHVWVAPEMGLLWVASMGGKLSDLGPGTAVKLKEGQSVTVELKLPSK